LQKYFRVAILLEDLITKKHCTSTPETLMHDSMIAKIDELMQGEIRFETLDESRQRIYVLDALKSCLCHATSAYDSAVTDEVQPSHDQIAALQTIYMISVRQILYTFAVLQDKSGLADTSTTFGFALKQLLRDLLEMTRAGD
jgi:hypothetical protein